MFGYQDGGIKRMASVGYVMLLISPVLFIVGLIVGGLLTAIFLVSSFVCGILGIIFAARAEFKTKKEMKNARA